MDEFEQDVQRALTSLTVLERAIATGMPKGVAAGARLLLADAGRLVPRRTGALAASGFEESVENDTTSATHRVGFRKFYARPVDKGHPIRSGKTGKIVGRAAAVRFLSGPAEQGRRTRIAREVTGVISAEVERETRRYFRR